MTDQTITDIETELELPEFGDPIGSIKATVIDYTHRENAYPGGHANGVVLCHYKHNIGDFVTWVAYHNGDEWMLQSGVYPRTFAEAIDSYRERAGF